MATDILVTNSSHYLQAYRTLWSDAEMVEIISDALAIDADLSLRVNSDGTPVRGIGAWEEMRLDQRDMIRHALKV